MADGLSAESEAIDPADVVVVARVSPTRVVVFGPDDVLERVAEESPSEVVGGGWKKALRHLAAAAPGAADLLTSSSGRIVELTAESARALNEYGATLTESGAVYGVVRDGSGAVAQHLRFVSPGVAVQFATSLASVAAGVALQLQLQAIEKKLAEIEGQLEYVARILEHDKLASLTTNLRKLTQIYDEVVETGTVSDDTYARLVAIEQSVLDLQELAALQIGQLRDHLKGVGNSSVAKAAAKYLKVLQQENADFWFRAYALAEQSSAKWSVLHLIRTGETEPELLQLRVADQRKQRLEAESRMTGALVDLREFAGDDERRRLRDRVRPFKRRQALELTGKLRLLVNTYHDELVPENEDVLELAAERSASAGSNSTEIVLYRGPDDPSANDDASLWEQFRSSMSPTRASRLLKRLPWTESDDY